MTPELTAFLDTSAALRADPLTQEWIKNIPDEVRLVYRRRAAALQEYLLAELIEKRQPSHP